MEVSLRSSLSGEITGDASVVVPGRLLTDLVRLLPEDTVTLSYEEGEGVLSVTSGATHRDTERLQRGGLPPPSPARCSASSHRGEGATRDDRQGGPCRLTRRVASGTHRRARAIRGRTARDGCDRLLSPCRERNARCRPVDGSRGDHPGESVAEAFVRIASGSEDVGLGVHENHVIFSAGDVWLTSRRIDGQFRTTSSFCQSFEVEIDAARALLEVVRRAGLMAQRNAPLEAPIRGGGAHDLRADAGRRRGRRVDPDRVLR